MVALKFHELVPQNPRCLGTNGVELRDRLSKKKQQQKLWVGFSAALCDIRKARRKI